MNRPLNLELESVIRYYEYSFWRDYFQFLANNLYKELIRLIRLREEIINSFYRDKVTTSRILLGVIDRRTIAHSSSLRRIFENVLGLKIDNSDEIIRRVARGVPLERLVDSIEKLRLEEPPLLIFIYKLVGEVESIIRDSVYRGYLEEVDEIVARELNRDLSRLNNPFTIVSVIKTIVGDTLRLLPLYNPASFFIISTRCISNEAIDLFYPSLWNRESIDLLNSVGFRLKEILRLDDLTIYSHEENSLGYRLSLLIDRLYELLIRISRHTKRYVKVEDEISLFYRTMLRLASRVIETRDLKVSIRRIDRLKNRGAIELDERLVMLRGVLKTSTYSKSNLSSDLSREILRVVGLFGGLGLASIKNLSKREDKIEFEWTLIIDRDHIS
ncbi:MAG: hypothetical protein ABWJ42_07055 [Sulfolobales archaeon]